MAQTKVSPAELAPTLTQDANGWKVYDFGAWKEYRKRVTFTLTVGAGAIVAPLSSTNFPVGVGSLGDHYMNYNYATNGNAFGLSLVAEMTSGSSALNFTCTSVDGGNRTYTGHMDVVIVKA